MKIQSAEFLISSVEVSKCPKPVYPEYAFIGRSNVGKSSLINMITGRKNLAKTSSNPGKTQTINHFIINANFKPWYLVDLPGYGYARVSKTSRDKWELFIADYLEKRANLLNVFMLVDSRIEPQKIDLEFAEWLGENNIPFVVVFTKTDKLSKNETLRNIQLFKNKVLEIYEELPPVILSSSIEGAGKMEILSFIESTNPVFATVVPKPKGKEA
jgi:GTP-binding protein